MDLTSQPRVITLGARARHYLDQARTIMVKGQTSRGLFLHTDHNRILYLTADGWRGPLTLNLDSTTFTAMLDIGTEGHIDGAVLIFPSEGVYCDIAAGESWRPAAFPHPTLQPGIGERLASLMAHMPPVTDAPLAGVQELREGLVQRDFNAALDGTQQLLGCGRGLTPSGDDIVVGVLLMLNRVPVPHSDSETLRDFSEAVTHMAYQRTTLLSANLIECAAAGEADERLIAAVDYLGAGIGSAGECANGLRNWGASSGSDALIGMAAVSASPLP